MKSASLALRLCATLGLLLVAGATGYLHRSPVAILTLAVTFSVLYVAGKWPAWQRTLAAGNWPRIVAAVLATCAVQFALVGILYLLGYGFGSLLSPGRSLAAFELGDVWAACALLLFGGVTVVTAHLIDTRQRKSSTLGNVGEFQPLNSDETYTFDPAPITVDNFFESTHYSHGEALDAGTRPAGSVTDAAMIAAAEARLGVTFPPLLRQLYALQNGGQVGWLMVPAKDSPKDAWDDWRGAFAIDYCDLRPLEDLATLRDTFLDYLEPDDEGIPDNADRLIVLAQRYQDTTYLDYSRPGEPRVGIVDFEGSSEPDVHFESFDEFFAALRRVQND